MKSAYFTGNIMKWHLQINTRKMPWKGEKNPYKIWLSEIILQQTRVQQGLIYYEKFIEKYPDINKLAKAKDTDVFKLWEGLGYYNRCKNLLLTAKFISDEKHGVFPEEYEEILALKGVGTYTAAAISSFAYNLPHAVIDGNVFRVLSRFFGIAIPIDNTKGKKVFSQLAEKVLDKKNSASYNQAIMDFGATVCKPVLPLCAICPLQKNCKAFKKGLTNKLPVKEKNITKKNRWFTYFLFYIDEKIFIKKRTAKDIWQNLYEFYLMETPEKIDWNFAQVNDLLSTQLNIQNTLIKSVSPIFSQQLTHQTIKGKFIKIGLKKIPSFLTSYSLTDLNKIKRLPFPQFINQYLNSTLFI